MPETYFTCVDCRGLFHGIPFHGIGGRDLMVKVYNRLCGGCARRQLESLAASISIDRRVESEGLNHA